MPGDGPVRRSTLRRVVFWTLASLPLLVLLVVVVPFLVNIWGLSHPDHDEIRDALHQRMADRAQMTFQAQLDHLPRSYPGLQSPAFFLGGSSLVEIDRKDSEVFPDYLRRLVASHDIVNLGVSASDSFFIATRLADVVDRTPPSLVVVYTGHNDYTNAFREVVRPAYRVLPGTIFPRALALSPRFDPVSAANHVVFDYEVRAHLRLAEMGLLELDHAEFASYEQIVDEGLRANLDRMARLLADRQVPLVLVPAIGNLHVSPIGGPELRARYESARQLPNYTERIEELKAVRDLEYLGPELRGRSQVRVLMAGIAAEYDNVTVVDLEQLFMASRLPFDESVFMDRFHFNADGHRTVAELLAGAIFPTLERPR